MHGGGRDGGDGGLRRPTLLVPFVADGAIEERFWRSREVFLLFAGMFTTIVG
jgi:hypothetical protein